MKKILSLGVMIISLIVLSAMASALPVTIDWVKIDNDELSPGLNTIDDFERGQEVDVKVHLTATTGNLEDVQVEAVMRGSDRNELIEDITRSFNLNKDHSITKSLSLRLPDRLEQDMFLLRVRVEDKSGETTQVNYELQVRAERHSIVIKDIILNPENEVKAGRTLLASLRLKNMGEKDEEGVKVKVSIPELGISASDYVNEVEAENGDNDQATSNEVFLRIPADAETGEYKLVAEAFFEDGDEVAREETTIRVIGEESAPVAPKKEEKTVIIVPTDKQALTAGGAELFYPVTISNMGSESKAYTVSVGDIAWGSTRVSPSNFDVVNVGDSKTFNVHVKANSDASGDQVFIVTVKSGDNVLKQIPLTASISGGQAVGAGFKLTTVLEVLAVVLVVLIIIILLVFGLSRVTRKEDDEEKEDEAYY